MNCLDCIHIPVCELWRENESQDASCYTDPIGDHGGCTLFIKASDMRPVEQREWKVYADVDSRGRRTGYHIHVCECGYKEKVFRGYLPNFCQHCGAYVKRIDNKETKGVAK